MKFVQLRKGNSRGDARRAMPSAVMVAYKIKLSHKKASSGFEKPNTSGEIERGLIRIRFNRYIFQLRHRHPENGLAAQRTTHLRNPLFL
jgi:hypothetical protein